MIAISIYMCVNVVERRESHGGGPKPDCEHLHGIRYDLEGTKQAVGGQDKVVGMVLNGVQCAEPKLGAVGKKATLLLDAFANFRKDSTGNRGTIALRTLRQKNPLAGYPCLPSHLLDSCRV